MRPEDFGPQSPGSLIRSVRGHWTFVPNPLPPVLTFDYELIGLLSKADLALGELAGVGRRLPNPMILLRPFIRREAVLSSRIEGTVTQLDELFLYEADDQNQNHPADAGEVRNYVHATEYGLNALRDGTPISIKLLGELHRILLTDVRGAENRPGELRDRGVLIGRAGQTYETARFVPPCHTQIRPLLDQFVDYLRTARSLPIVVQLALAHYQFETIHPFNDGNGRVGRLLMALLLVERGILKEPLLYLSGYIEQNRVDYYDGLLNVSCHGAWNQWLAYVATAVAVQSRDAAMRATKLLDVANDLLKKAARVVRSPSLPVLIEELISAPYLTIQRIAEICELSFNTASRMVAKLVELGMLREVTGKARDRVFCADEIMHWLEAPMGDLPQVERPAVRQST